MILVWLSRRGAVARAFAAVLVAAGSASLAGCSSALIIDHIPAAIGGLPEGAPERPATPVAFPPVHSAPAGDRGPTVLTDAERKRLRDDLSASRDRSMREAASPTEVIDITPPAGAARN
jgi:hypothetical protein